MSKHHKPEAKLVAVDEAVAPEVIEEVAEATAEDAPGEAIVEEVVADPDGDAPAGPADEATADDEEAIDGEVIPPERVDFIPMPKPAIPAAIIDAKPEREPFVDATGRIIKPYPTLLEDLKKVDWGHDVRLAKLALANTAAIAGGRVIAGTKAVGRGLKSPTFKTFMGIFALVMASFFMTVQAITSPQPVAPNRIVCEAQGGVYLHDYSLCIAKNALIDLR